MANPEHLKILKQGVKVWNKWRKQPINTRPDLKGANLTFINLAGANLTDCHFRDADMYGANLKGADIRWTDLIRTSLEGADLTDSNLSMSDLHHTDLSGASLIGANLQYAEIYEANFTRARLTGADFTEAKAGGNIFGENDLSEIKGLNSVTHAGPSVIGIETLYNSIGKIPEIFLRGCGVPDEFITYARSLIEAGQAIQFYSCFMSYSSKDQDFANRVYADLQNKGVRCWFAPEDLKIGDRIRDRIDESIRLRDKLLLILSEHSIASEWVEHEVESALEEERRKNRTILFPIRLDDAVMESSKAWAALIRRTRHIGDFTKWKEHDSYQKAFDRLLRDLKAESNS